MKMALLKTKDIKAMRPDDIKAKFKELSDELMHERGVAAMGGAPASPGKIRAIRTNVARILTIMQERELEAKKAKKEKAPAKKKGRGKAEDTPKSKPKKTAEKPKMEQKKSGDVEEEETK